MDTGILFSDSKGVYKPRIEKNKTKLLQKLGFLAKFLDADEKITLVTTGCSPFTSLEQLTIGAAWVVIIKRALFVFTNKRLFHIPVTSSFKYRGSVAQILYRDCRGLFVKGSALVAEYHDGGKDKFLYIPGCDRAVIKKLVFQVDESARPSDSPRRNHLCPNCTQVLPAGADACPACGLGFKNKATARKYSLLFPGGGYFYTNHPFIGIGDALGESYLLLFTLGCLISGLLGDPRSWPVAIVFALVLTIEKLVTIYHSNSFLAEFIPKNLKAVLSGQISPAKPMEPLPPMEEVPQRRLRTEDILSIR
ncbi:MAG: zinc ribbon domain-containing protein [Phycisphaerales bacterium]